jgi:putative DNA-invertase from lambdoid prophage Rac
MTRYAYLRVSTDMQDHQAQRLAIKRRHEIDQWVQDVGSGRITQPNLNRLLRNVKRGDEVYVYAFDRLGRSTASVIGIVESFKRKGISLVSVKEGIDINSPAGNMIFQMLCSIAEFEASLISDRVKAGLDAARERGVKLGAPTKVDRNPNFKHMMELAKQYRDQGLSYREITYVLKEKHKYKISYGSLYKYLPLKTDDNDTAS